MTAMHFDAQTGTLADEAMPDEAIRYSRGRNKYDNNPEQRTAHGFDAFEDAVLADCSARKGQTFVCAPFRINGDGRPHRGKTEALPRAFLPFDLDSIPDADTFNELRQWFTAYRGFGYTTASHRPDAPRCRIVLAADRPMDRDEGKRACLAIQRRVEKDFGLGLLKFDESVYRAEQPLFTPLHGATTFRFLGDPVDVDKLLAEIPPDTESDTARRNEPGAHTDWLAALLEGDDVHGNACRLVGRWVALGWDDATIRATMDALAIGVAAARGQERAAELCGEELDRMIEGARRNGYDRPRDGAAEHPHDDDEAKDSRLRLIPATREEVAAARLTPREILPGILFADVRLRASAGGAGKTTLALHEAAMLALGRTLYGETPSRPMRTVFVTREDQRETMIARLREICREMSLAQHEQDEVFERVQVMDLSGQNWRLTAVVDDVVIPNTVAIDALLGEIEPFAPDWVVFDPAVSFGTGEARTNDAEQGLIDACRIIRNRLGCCTELIHHSGKGNARDGARDQYAFRGGSALADGARMVVIINPLEPDAWRSETGLPLQDGEAGAVLTFAKVTFAKRPEDIYIRRRGFRFDHVLPSRQSAEQRRDNQAEQVLQFLRDQGRQGRRYSAGLLEDSRDTLGLTRQEVRAAIAVLLATGRIVRATGARNTQWLAPSPSVAEHDGETAPETDHGE